jgi:hypothetical protein
VFTYTVILLIGSGYLDCIASGPQPIFGIHFTAVFLYRGVSIISNVIHHRQQFSLPSKVDAHPERIIPEIVKVNP